MIWPIGALLPDLSPALNHHKLRPSLHSLKKKRKRRRT
jgi:hypothetical protein